MVQRPPAGTIPDAPGSYQFTDAHGRVISVGMARGLRQRLSNYLWWWVRIGEHRVIEEPVSLRSVAWSVLTMLGVDPPQPMDALVLRSPDGGPQSPFKVLTSPADNHPVGVVARRERHSSDFERLRHG